MYLDGSIFRHLVSDLSLVYYSLYSTELHFWFKWKEILHDKVVLTYLSHLVFTVPTAWEVKRRLRWESQAREKKKRGTICQTDRQEGGREHHRTEIEREAELEREGGRITGVFVTVKSKNASMNFGPFFLQSGWASSQSFLFTRLLPDDVVLSVSWSVIWYSSQKSGPLYVCCVSVCLCVCAALSVDPVFINYFRFQAQTFLLIRLFIRLWLRIPIINALVTSSLFSTCGPLRSPVCRLHTFTSWNRGHKFVLWFYEMTNSK